MENNNTISYEETPDSTDEVTGITIPIENLIADAVIRTSNVLVIFDPECRQDALYLWDGRRYIIDKGEERTRATACAIISRIFPAAVSFFSKSPRMEAFEIDGFRIYKKQARAYAQKIGFMKNLVNIVVETIISNPSLRRIEDEFDNNDSVINTLDGVLDLKTLQIIPHNPSQLLRRIVNARYIGDLSPENEPKDYTSIFSDALYDPKLSGKENEAVVDSYLDILGYGLIGGNPEKTLLIVVGKTNSGKSTEQNIRQTILGDYFATINAKSLMKNPRSGNDIQPGILRTRFARFVSAVETEEKEVFNTPLLKGLSGADEQSFRRPHRDIIHFQSKAKFCISTNEIPRFSNIDDEAFLQRLVIIEFKNRVPDEKLDKSLIERLTTPDMRNRIFTMLAQHANKYLTTGKLNISAAFHASKELIILAQSDLIKSYWVENITLRPIIEFPELQFHYPVKLLYTMEFRPYCQERGVEPPSLTAFGTRFREIAECYPGVTRHDSNSGIRYTGINIALRHPEYFSMEQYREMIKFQS